MKSAIRPIIIWDTETTGLAPKENHIIEIAMMELKCTSPFKNVFNFSSLIHPTGIEKPRASSRVHGITNPMMQDAPDFREVWSGVKDFVNHISFRRGRPIMVAHNLSFDKRFLEEELKRIGELLPDWDFACSLRDVANILWPGQRASLAALTERFNITNHEAHRALSDVIATSEFLSKADDYLRNCNIGNGNEAPIPGRKIREIIESAAERRRQQNSGNSTSLVFRTAPPLSSMASGRQRNNESKLFPGLKQDADGDRHISLRRSKRISLNRRKVKGQKEKLELNLHLSELISRTAKSGKSVNDSHVFTTNHRKAWHMFLNCRTLINANSVVKIRRGSQETKKLKFCHHCKNNSS